MKKRPYPSEQNINKELRELTEQTRKLREELRDMVSTPRPKDVTRSLLHVQTWPKERRRDAAQTTTDRRRKKR